MNQDISESDDRRPISDHLQIFRSLATDTRQGLADNLKLAFERMWLDQDFFA
jgi:hypothetical protein